MPEIPKSHNWAAKTPKGTPSKEQLSNDELYVQAIKRLDELGDEATPPVQPGSEGAVDDPELLEWFKVRLLSVILH